jgi:hypothetical protein
MGARESDLEREGNLFASITADTSATLISVSSSSGDSFSFSACSVRRDLVATDDFSMARYKNPAAVTENRRRSAMVFVSAEYERMQWCFGFVLGSAWMQALLDANRSNYEWGVSSDT